MKKVVSLFLATLMMLSTMSCLSIVAFGADDVDGNGTYDDATEITIGEKAIGAISNSSDYDWYKFTSSEDYFTVDFSPVDKSNADSKWHIRIYDNDMNLLSENLYCNSFSSTKFAYFGEIYICVEEYHEYENVNYAINVKSFVDDSREDEYNNSSDDAKFIETNKKYVGELNNNEDVDWYKFESDKNYFTVDFSPVDKTNTDAIWHIYIYDDEMNLLSRHSYTNSFSTSKLAYFGVIYIYVEHYNNTEKVDYQIKVNTFEDSFREAEYNDSKSDANLISTNQTYEGELNNDDDVDWYKFESDKNYFTLDFGPVDKTNTDAKWHIYIYDSNMNLLNNYSYCPSVSTEIFANTGTIYVKIIHYTDTEKVDYTLRANTYENIVWEKESNNTSTTANTINQDTTYKGTLVKSDDVDYYKFKATSDAFKIKLTIDLNETSLDKIDLGWKVSVYPADTAASVVKEYVVDDIGSFETRTLPYEKGKEYFVKVSASKSSDAPIDAIYNIAAIDASNGNKWEIENGKVDLPSATTVNSGETIFGNFYQGTDKDYYKISVPAEGQIKLVFNRTESENACSGWKFTLVDGVGSKVQDTVNLGNSLNATWTSGDILKEGNYYIVMESVKTGDAPSPEIDYNITPTYTMATPALKSVSNSTKGVTVKWYTVNDCDGYYVYRKASGAKSWSRIAILTGDAIESYTDTNVSSGKSYTYTVKAFDGETGSGYNTKGLSIKFLSTPKLVSAKSSKAGITFKWGKVAGASGYIVYRKTGSGSWVKLTTVKGNTKVSYVDKSAKKGKTYTYTVRAYSGSYTSYYNTKGLSVKDKY